MGTSFSGAIEAAALEGMNRPFGFLNLLRDLPFVILMSLSSDFDFGICLLLLDIAFFAKRVKGSEKNTYLRSYQESLIAKASKNVYCTKESE